MEEMKIGIIYIFGKPGSGKTVMSDEIEKRFLQNEGFISVPVDDSNLEEVFSRLDEFGNTLLNIQSNRIQQKNLQVLKKFVENSDFIRGVVIQSEFEPNSETEKYCEQIFETGYPHFSWVTNVGDGFWEAKAAKTEKTARSFGKIQACELVRDYKTDGSNRINRERF